MRKFSWCLYVLITLTFFKNTMHLFSKNVFISTHYSNLPNNCAANLIIFRDKKTTTQPYQDLHIHQFLIFFLQNLILNCIKEKNPSQTALIRPTRLVISEKSATYTIKWSYTIIWQVRVNIIISFEYLICGQKSAKIITYFGTAKETPLLN